MPCITPLQKPSFNVILLYEPDVMELGRNIAKGSIIPSRKTSREKPEDDWKAAMFNKLSLCALGPPSLTFLNWQMERPQVVLVQTERTCVISSSCKFVV